MHRHLLPLAVVLALAPGCKAMGGVMSGVAHGVARATPAIAKGVAHVGGAVARGVVRATPTVVRVTETLAEAAATMPDFAIVVPVEIAPSQASSDPCLACPLDAECGDCAGYAGYACVGSPAGALGRCESSAPPDAEPAEAGPAPGPPG